MKISTRISLMGITFVAGCSVVLVGVLLAVKTHLDARIKETVTDQGKAEMGKLVQSIHNSFMASEARTQRRLAYNFQVTKETFERAGKFSCGEEMVSWQAVNQISKQATPVNLPKLFIGSTWLGQNTSAVVPSPIVDDVKYYTRDHATVFQRMNEEGDMLRVCTTVIATNGNRAVGTFIPRRNPDGSENPVLAAVLRGEPYHGRAFVVSEWHAAQYEPIWDAQKQKIIGMLYVGVPLGDVTKELRQLVTSAKMGKNGYAFTLGASGDNRGKYIISKDGERDGENIWDVKDSTGRLVTQEIIAKALKTEAGSPDFVCYPWQNKGETSSRSKIAAVTYFKPYDWVIGASAYEDDFMEISGRNQAILRTMLWWEIIAAGVVAVLSLFASFWVSRGITRPIKAAADALSTGADQTTAAAGQVSSSSQSLAQGSSEQAASIEETSSSLEEMASMTRRNAENAQKANDLAKQARTAADRSVTDMQAMSSAMAAIKASSDDIAKILKTIDEIAFQTNILALNAAVEAARAGEAGMGFAVVADEVRNLAQRSAQAARETAAKIEGAIRCTAQGVDITRKVAVALDDIVNKSRQVDELAAEVANASREQTQGITQINAAVGEMDKVTQSNAANAEEGAAAAEELNSQAQLMKQSVSGLLQLVGGRADGAPPGRPGSPAACPARPGRKLPGAGRSRQSTKAESAVASANPEATGRRDEIPLEEGF